MPTDLDVVHAGRDAALRYCRGVDRLDAESTARGEVYDVTYLFRVDEDIVETWWGRELFRFGDADRAEPNSRLGP